FGEKLAETHSLIELLGLNDEDCEGRGVFQVRLDLFDGFVAFFISEFVDSFGVFEEDELQRRKHGKRLPLIHGGLDFVAIGRKTGNSPGARSGGNEALDELSATGVAEIGFFAKQENCWDRSSLFKTRQQITGGDLRHQ